MSRLYLTTADVTGIHDVLLQRYGGAEGIRDMGAIESAVFRPQSGYYSDIVQETSALMESLLVNHPFVDGNKRTAFGACDVFVRINSCRIQATSEQCYKMIIKWLELESAVRLEHIEANLRSCILAV